MCVSFSFTCQLSYNITGNYVAQIIVSIDTVVIPVFIGFTALVETMFTFVALNYATDGCVWLRE